MGGVKVDPGDPRTGGPGDRDPGTREPEVPGTRRVPGGPGRVREHKSKKVPFFEEPGHSDLGFRILASNYIGALQDHQKWMKFDPFRAYLKLRESQSWAFESNHVYDYDHGPRDGGDLGAPWEPPGGPLWGPLWGPLLGP